MEREKLSKLANGSGCRISNLGSGISFLQIASIDLYSYTKWDFPRRPLPQLLGRSPFVGCLSLETISILSSVESVTIGVRWTTSPCYVVVTTSKSVCIYAYDVVSEKREGQMSQSLVKFPIGDVA
jgi:hypothetical protein